MNVYISTWFYESPEGERIDYPGVGNHSDTWSFQKIYWNCIYTFFETATAHCISNNEINFKFLLFLNKDLPSKSNYDDEHFDPAEFLMRKNVEIINYFPEHIPSADVYSQFRTQFVMIDILEKIEKKLGDQDVFIILDSDCIFINKIPEISLVELKTIGVQYIKNSWVGDNVSNGMSNQLFNETANNLLKVDNKLINYFCGGEYFGFNKSILSKFNEEVDLLYSKNSTIPNPLKTEEQLFTVAINFIMNEKFSDAAKFIKRVWTHDGFRTTDKSDQYLSILHLPAEKNKGFKLFCENYIFNKNNLEFNFLNLKHLFHLEENVP